MGFSKASAFPLEQQALAICGKIIAHPARIQIIEFLYTNGSSCVMEIATTIPLSYKSIGQHLAKLRELGILKAEEKTPFIYYTLDKEILEEVAELMVCFFEKMRPMARN